MKLIHLVQGLEIGGLEWMVVNLLESTRSGTCQADVVCYDQLGSLAPRLEQRGIKVRLLRRRTGVDLRYVLALTRLLATERPDILHLHNPTAFFYGALAGRLARVPAIVYTDHGRDLASSRRNNFLHGALARLVDQVVAVCESGSRNLIQQEGVAADRVMVIRNGIDGRAFATSRQRREVRAMLGLSAAQPVIGVVARLDPIKNHALLLRAMRRVADRLPGAWLLVIGDGPLRGELEALAVELRIEGHAIFLGARNDIPDLLAALDVFVLPSLTEGLSLTLIECCAAGKPIVATDVGGNREVVHHGENGLLVPSADEKALAAAIEEVVADPARAADMGRAARRRFEAEFTLEAMTARYCALYERLAPKGTVSAPIQA